LHDPFMAFWFAFFYRYRSAIESNNTEYLKQRFEENYTLFAGYWLERLFADIYQQSGEFNLIGTYWESGNQNEIDIVAINDAKMLMILAEVKIQKKNIRKERLIEKSVKLHRQYPDYRIEYRYHGLEDLMGEIAKLRK
ncbi:MAG: DUF234 domain-containing protein, partial [Candidatus Cloacimonetes bacterium]|nr:DUF234 domain-containing protein [Candidatus Cloacimonadota bacterium]